MTETHHVVVIGTGSAGLSAALSLRDRGRRALVVDKAGQVAAAWRGRYDRLMLNTGRDFSHLPGRPYPKGTPTFPTRDQVVLAGPLYHAPLWFADAFSRYGRKRAIGDRSEFGLPVPAEGPFTRLKKGRVPTVVDMEVIDAIRDRLIEVVPTIEAFEGNAVKLVDGGRLEPDAVICATGYRRGLEPLVGHLGVLDESGKPRAQGDQPAADGLWFLGYMTRPSLIRQVVRQSRRVAKRIG